MTTHESLDLDDLWFHPAKARYFVGARRPDPPDPGLVTLRRLRGPPVKAHIGRLTEVPRDDAVAALRALGTGAGAQVEIAFPALFPGALDDDSPAASRGQWTDHTARWLADRPTHAAHLDALADALDTKARCLHMRHADGALLDERDRLAQLSGALRAMGVGLLRWRVLGDTIQSWWLGRQLRGCAPALDHWLGSLRRQRVFQRALAATPNTLATIDPRDIFP